MNKIKGKEVHFLGKHPMFDEPEFKERAIAEATLAAEGKISRLGFDGKPQSLEQKLHNTITGHRAEWYLIKEHDFKDDVGICCDVFSPKGNEVEVKVSAGSPHSEKGKQWRKQQLAKAKKQFLNGVHQAKIVYLFGHNKYNEGHPYKFEATYKWSEEKNQYVFESEDMIL